MNQNNNNNLAKKTLKRRKRLRKKMKRQRNVNMRRRRRRVRRNQRAVRLVNPINWKRSMRIVRSSEDSMTVTGTDLVYQVPDVELSEAKQVLCVIPSNPAYWIGTRVSSLAIAYQQFRPLKFQVHYVPIVSAMQQGAIFAGTLWGSVPETSYLQQTLVTSQGRIDTQVYQPKSSTVNLASKLTKNLYNVGGELNQDSNPFYYVAIGVANFNTNSTRIVPGYFVVSYTYVFKNPLGNNIRFGVQSLTKFSEINYRTNTTILNCNPNKEDGKGNFVPLFSELQVNTNQEGDYEVTLNGEFIHMDDDDLVWSFTNFTSNAFLQRVVRNISLPSTQLAFEGASRNISINGFERVAFRSVDGSFRIYSNYQTGTATIPSESIATDEDGKIRVWYFYPGDFTKTDGLQSEVEFTTSQVWTPGYEVIDYYTNEYQFITVNNRKLHNLELARRDNYNPLIWNGEPLNDEDDESVPEEDEITISKDKHYGRLLH